jgi:hypothetical protein
LLKLLAIQIGSALDRFNLRQNGRCTLLIACDWYAFATSDVLAVAHAYDHHVCFRAAAARDPKWVLKWPEFFLGFDLQSGE